MKLLEWAIETKIDQWLPRAGWVSGLGVGLFLGVMKFF